MNISSVSIYKGLLSLKREAEENPARFVKICVGASLAVAGGSALLAGTEMVAVASLTAGVGIALLLDASRQTLPPRTPLKKALPKEEISPPESIEQTHSVQTAVMSARPPVPPRWKGEFLKRIRREERELHLKAIADLGHVFTEDQKALLRKRVMFEHPSKKLLILQAYLEEIIDEHDASFLFLKETALEVDPGCEEHDLIDINGINPVASGYFKSCLRTFLGSRDLDSFLESLLKNLQETPWKSKFILMQTSFNWSHQDDRLGDQILEHIHHNGPFIYAPRTWSLSSERKLLILPLDLLQWVYQKKYRENAIKMIPVLGYSQIECFSNWRQRVVAIPSCMNLPTELHGLKAGGIGTFIHDSYLHCALESSNPDREFWATVAQKFKNSKQPNAQLLLERLLDREFFSYTRTHKESAFWLSYGNVIDLFWRDLPQKPQNTQERDSLAQTILEFRQAFVDTWSEAQHPIAYLQALRKDEAVTLFKKFPLFTLQGMQKEAPPIELFKAVIEAFERFPTADFYSQFLAKAAQYIQSNTGD